MDGVRKQKRLKFKKNIQKRQTQQNNNFDEWFDEFEFLEKYFSASVNQQIAQQKEIADEGVIQQEQVRDSQISNNQVLNNQENKIQSSNVNELIEQETFQKDLSSEQVDQQYSQPFYSIDQLSDQSEQFGSFNENQNNSETDKQSSYLKSEEDTAEQSEFNFSTRKFNKSNVENHFVDDRFNNFFESEEEESPLSFHKLSFKKKIKDLNFSLADIFQNNQFGTLVPKSVYSGFFIFVGIFALGFGFFSFVGNTFAVKENVMGAGERAVDSLKSAVSYASDKNFQSSEEAVNKAHDEMVFASEEMNSVNNMAVFISEFIPGASQLSSGKNIVETGKYLTHAGKEMNSLAPIILDIVNSKEDQSMEDISLLQIYQNLLQHISVVYQDVKQANDHIEQVNLDDVPYQYKNKFADMKNILPHIEESLEVTVSGQDAIEDILGANGPRKYLFLFQNNHEMRATGGFIGSYGLLEISSGKITNFKVEGIFDPDGQLIDRVVPPLPIQKISADWSLHDSNWFPNFPTSAEKAIDFYERTGGPTVDGVITITPTMMKRILDITGSIKLDEYDTEVSSKNFMEVIQSEVEEDYDKDENKPKKILSDLTPMVFEKILSSKDPKNLAGILNVISNGLDERHILIYMRNDYIQDVISKNGWSGEIIDTDKDYLSVVNSNVNGFKTDGVVKETIKHSAKIHEDGSVIDTVTITRKNEGGYTGFEWWDKVNADYMRVYVPEGSRLLSVEGQTREVNEERLDYNTLGYERDNDVVAEEENMIIDEESGTRIYEEEGKTVFANWVYVSPQETVTITYSYILPFKVKFDQDEASQFGSYASVFQKQSGSENSSLESEIVLPENFELFWETDDVKDLKMEDELRTDLYHGVVFRVD